VSTLKPELLAPGPRVPALPRALRSLLESRLARLQHGGLRLDETGTGRETRFGDARQAPTLSVHDPRFYADVVLRGSIGAAESYAAGRWTCDDLPGLVRLLLRNREVLDTLESGPATLMRPLQRLAHLLRPNTRHGARRNISEHYDLGNDFFELFLDETMTYSCALFEREDTPLAKASIAKLDRLCRKLDLKPGDRLLEIGTGWGSLALHAARQYGCHVTTTTISERQHDLAAERIRAAGLSERVTLLQEDYRDLRGRWDKLISIEMIEAVGDKHLPTYLEQCGRLLEPHGLFALQAITIADQHYDRARKDVDFIKRHIFPGSFIPSVTAILEAATARSDLRLTHLEDMAPHYATTLARWRANLAAARETALERGYGDELLRLWDYYFAYCEGGFAERFLGVSQMLLARPEARRPALLPALS
jgi:cyclopropane-fatty-acyl-phospholipid synthase